MAAKDEEITRLRQLVAELEGKNEELADHLVACSAVASVRGERMKKICQWLEYPSFEARQDWHDVKDKWFDETGEPL